ncbi:tumor necrosis factor ligand superfamily member 6 [Spea bombifrons]|uniref:tumor necrosis factor ligand superfamily member 6 n=1 Tax=Spea bombifrons TaxID=233779 RepID=UPI00234BB612|nr:tumor necrosis factor ligand superfamily member 6 [Spea bombifrons]
MHQNQSYLHPQMFWTTQHANPTLPNHPNVFLPQPPFPDLRKKRSKDGTCTCLLIIFLLVLLALTGVGLGTYKIVELQRELDQIKEISGDTENTPSMEKLVDLGKQLEKKEGRLAAHVTGKEGKSLPLAWEDTFGRAFTAGIQYKNRGLIVNQTGLHYLYSSVYFRGTSCQNKKLAHVVYKKSFRYPSELNLMENVEYHRCADSGIWGRHSYLGAVFNLTIYDILYVNVSDVRLVNFDESKTFFGIYKL